MSKRVTRSAVSKTITNTKSKQKVAYEENDEESIETLSGSESAYTQTEDESEDGSEDLESVSSGEEDVEELEEVLVPTTSSNTQEAKEITNKTERIANDNYQDFKAKRRKIAEEKRKIAENQIKMKSIETSSAAGLPTALEFELEENQNIDDQIESNQASSSTSTAATPASSSSTAGVISKKKKVPKIDFNTIHPDLEFIWRDLKEKPKPDLLNQLQPPRMTVTLLPFQREGLKWMMIQERESEYKGGILADEMGLGKTIQMISLIVSRLDECREKPTLILCPAIALMQWASEFEKRVVPGCCQVLVFHGTDRVKKTSDIIGKYQVVLTTYAILEHGFRKEHYGTKRKGYLIKEKSLLHSIEWSRFVLDEAHAIKDRYSSTARACFAIKSRHQWCLSGTPLQNRVGELFSLIRLLNLYPHSYYFCRKCPCKMQSWKFSDHIYCDECGHTGHQHFCYWNAEILKPIQKYGAAGEGLLAFEKLSSILSQIMLRRTKLERNDELGLPPRLVECRSDFFNPAEEELYESLYSDTTRQFSTYVNSGTVLNNYASIFSLLSRMRLAANHPDLCISKLAPDVKSKLVCVVCQDEAEDAIVSSCKHVFCREDARQYIQSAPGSEPPKCPSCHKSLVIDLTQPEMEDMDPNRVQTSIVNQIDLKTWRSSTKIEALVEELERLKRQDCTIKSLVFSQFVSFLDLVHWRLSRAGFNCVKLDGRMSPSQRASIINSFNTDPEVTVFLVSLKAGGVGINLTEASRCFLLDPWWNPAVENQAFDRIHRLGQVRPILITRLVIENSIESRIIELQAKKKALFESTIGNDVSSLSRLSEEDFRFLFVL